MKLNEKGKELYNIWERNYCKENDNLGGNSANGDFVEGWCIIDNGNYVKTLTDECGLLIFGYDDDAIHMVDEWIDMWGKNDICFNNYTFEDVRKELLKYFETENKRVLQISLDIVVGCECNGVELAEDVFNELNRRGFNVVGSGFNEDMTKLYKSLYPNLLEN